MKVFDLLPWRFMSVIYFTLAFKDTILKEDL